jgi:oligoribonuclease (3'-5' exoribonuclease)
MGKHIREFYISIDMEADGPCPGVNSMLQFGAVFYDSEGKLLDEYLVNIAPLDGVQDPDTMKWWAEQEVKNPGLWASMEKDRVTPKLAMERFQSKVRKWAAELKCSPIVFAYPAGYDFTWLYWYLCKFLGQSCVGFSAIDMKTIAMCLLQRTYHDSSKRRFPRSWFNPAFRHTHNALDDAREQGYNFFAMKKSLGIMWDSVNEDPMTDATFGAVKVDAQGNLYDDTGDDTQ